MGRVSGRVADQTKGGFLDDVDAEIVGARFEKTSFEGDDGEMVNKTQAVVEFTVEGREDPIPVFLSVGSQKVIVPCEDESGETEAEVGQFLCGAEGKDLKGENQNSAWARFKAALVTKCKFPDENFDAPVEEALTGLRGHLINIPGGKFKGKDGRPVPVFSSIEKDSIPAVGKKSSKKGAKKSGGLAGLGKKTRKEEEEVEEEVTPPAKKASSAKQPPRGKATEPADEEGDALEVRVAQAVQKAVKKAPLPKGRLAQAVGKVFEGDEQRSEAVKLTMSDKFLKAGVEEELWSFDGRQVSTYEAPEEAEEETEEEDEE